MKKRVAFDLDETLGIPIIEQNSIAGFRIREGAIYILNRLQQEYSLLLWTVSKRSYVEKALSYGLKNFFDEVYSWGDIATTWKDIRRIKADYLIDDSDYHKEAAKVHGIEQGYILIPAYGCLEDQREPLLWVRQIEQILL